MVIVMQQFLDKVGLERVWQHIKSHFQIGHGLERKGNVVSVKMYDDSNNDKTLPVSMQAVESIVGDIESFSNSIENALKEI